MAFPRFRYTLSNTIQGSQEIDEPGGWDEESFLKLERDKVYHSLIESYEQPLLFYGNDGIHDGGYDYIKSVEAAQGPEAVINILIEVSEDEGTTYETYFEGVLALDTVKEIDFYTIECGVRRNDFWSKFMNRKSIPVDLGASIDVDGNAITPVGSFELPLPSQQIRTNYYAQLDEGDGELNGDDSIGTSDYIQVGFDNTTIDEIDEVFNVPTAINSDVPAARLIATYDGVYTFNLRQECSILLAAVVPDGGGGSTQAYSLLNLDSGHGDFEIRYRVNDGIPTPFSGDFTRTNYDNSAVLPLASPFDGIGEYESTVFEFTGSLTLKAGDEVKIYCDVTETFDNNNAVTVATLIIWGANQPTDVARFVESGNLLVYSGTPTSFDFPGAPSQADIPTFWDIQAQTTYNATTTDAYLIKDAAESIISKLVGAEDVIISDYLSADSPAGCGGKYAVMKGLHVRGYSMTDKPFFLSFDDWWAGANPIFNLGLGYELGGSPETDKIRIEQKSYFYDPDPVVLLDFVNNIERRYENDFIFKAIEIGYQKWSAESVSGVDDPQTKRTYRTNFASIGKDDKNLSKFIAASLAIEQTRRNRVEQGKDWRLDEDTMIIALVDGSPTYEPELDQNFQAITDLLNSDTRYNTRLSCARNFIRWRDFYSGCMQWQFSDFVFTGGEGNYDMTSQLNTDDCDATEGVSEPVVSESQDISPTSEPLFVPVVWEFEHPLSWDDYKTIRNNRNKGIGVSRTDENHMTCFILNLDWSITTRKGKFTVLLHSLRTRIETETASVVATGYAPTVSAINLLVTASTGVGQGTITGYEPTAQAFDPE